MLIQAAVAAVAAVAIEEMKKEEPVAQVTNHLTNLIPKLPILTPICDYYISEPVNQIERNPCSIDRFTWFILRPPLKINIFEILNLEFL